MERNQNVDLIEYLNATADLIEEAFRHSLSLIQEISDFDTYVLAAGSLRYVGGLIISYKELISYVQDEVLKKTMLNVSDHWFYRYSWTRDLLQAQKPKDKESYQAALEIAKEIEEEFKKGIASKGE